MKQHNLFGGIDEIEFIDNEYKIIMGKEDKLQSQIVLDFSQKRPNEKGLLWSTRNQTFSARDGQKQKAMGMTAGVADLIYHNEGLMGLEVKVKGEEHKRDHIINQLNWGKTITESGGHWCIITSVAGFWHVLEVQDFEHEGVYSIKDVERLLSVQKSVIVF